jgi:uncharacterized protein (TIGR03118 family)
MTRTFLAYILRCGLGVLSLGVLGGCERDKRYIDVVFERVDLTVDQELDQQGDQGGVGAFADSHLVDPTGLQISPNGSFWVANGATGTVTVYGFDGTPLPTAEPLVVNLPVPATLPAGTAARATGAAYFGDYGLEIVSGTARDSARFLFATREGTILGYNPVIDRDNAIIAVDNSATGAVYWGLSAVALRSGARLYATNFHSGKVDVFDENFAPATGLDPAAFQDLELPAGFAPFGIQRIDDRLYVSFAQQDAAGVDPVSGPGKGYIDSFTLGGRFLARVASEGDLDTPYGMALAPWSMPYFGGALLVANTGDGRINAYDLYYNAGIGGLNDQQNQTLFIDGLKDLSIGYGIEGAPAIYFSAGPNGGQNGVLGTLLTRFIDVDPPHGD